MKATLMVLLAIGTLSAYAGLRFNHLVYVCQNDNGVIVHVLKPGIPAEEKQDLNGQMLVYNMSADSAPELGMWCDSLVKEGRQTITIADKELIAEDPSACEFVLNTANLTANYNYKRWKGYVGGLKKPVIKTNENLTCEVRDEIVNY